MKICWDTLENLRYDNKNRCLRKINNRNRADFNSCCKNCGEDFVSFLGGTGEFCSRGCISKFYGNIRRGEKRPEQSKRLLGSGNPAYGKKLPEERKQKISNTLKERGICAGSNNPNWRGGISKEPYCFVFGDKEWREFIFDRDKDKHCWNPQCLWNSKQEVLHHINYNKKDCKPKNIIKICSSCNTSANFNREWWQSFYVIIMEKRGY